MKISKVNLAVIYFTNPVGQKCIHTIVGAAAADPAEISANNKATCKYSR